MAVNLLDLMMMDTAVVRVLLAVIMVLIFTWEGGKNDLG